MTSKNEQFNGVFAIVSYVECGVKSVPFGQYVRLRIYFRCAKLCYGSACLIERYKTL